MKSLFGGIVLLWCFGSVHAQYYHPFQNFDDDVDRIKTYSNFFGGDHGIMDGDTSNPQIATEYDTTETRTGYGRSLRIEYGPLDGWSMYLESFERRWVTQETWLDLTDLFPDFENPQFQGRHVDSLVFHCKLMAEEPLTMKVELHDALDNASTYSLSINPSIDWQRIAVAFNQFSGSFDATIAKYLGLAFADYPGNWTETGVLYIDDFYFVEDGFSKPSFSTDVGMLEYLNEVNFRHFWMAVEPASGFALDRHIWSDLISVDAIGFQLTSYVIAHRRGWIEESLVEARVEHILDYLLHHCAHASDTLQVQADPLGYATVNGIWAHFLDSSSLARKDSATEFSLFSNALLLSGVLVCREYFSSNANIVAWADSLYRMTDWNFLYIPGEQLMYYAWRPESSFSEYYTDWWSEELDLAFLLAISTPEMAHRLPANPFFSIGYAKPWCSYWPTGGFVYSASGANFTYYFMQMYSRYPLDLRFSSPRFDNAHNALLADLSFCQDEYAFMSYDPRIFGTTACEGPDSAGIGVSNYHAYGYPCRFDTGNIPNGTVAVYGSGASIPFIPDEAIACLRYYYDELDTLFANTYGYSFWSPIFGFPDAFHLAPDQCNDPDVNGLGFRGPWLSVPRFGIDIGPMLMNIDSYLSELAAETSIRDLFSQHPDIVGNLEDFDPISVTCFTFYIDINDERMNRTTGDDCETGEGHEGEDGS